MTYPVPVSQHEMDSDTPLLDGLLKIDNTIKRRQEALRLLVFKRRDVQVEITTAMYCENEELENLAHELTIFLGMSRSDVQFAWDLHCKCAKGT